MSRKRNYVKVWLLCCDDTIIKILLPPPTQQRPEELLLRSIFGEPETPTHRNSRRLVRLHMYYPHQWGTNGRVFVQCPHCHETRSITRDYAHRLADQVRAASPNLEEATAWIPWDEITTPSRTSLTRQDTA